MGRRRDRRPRPAALVAPIAPSLDQPRAERAYSEIYPDLDVDAPLTVSFGHTSHTPKKKNKPPAPQAPSISQRLSRRTRSKFSEPPPQDTTTETIALLSPPSSSSSPPSTSQTSFASPSKVTPSAAPRSGFRLLADAHDASNGTSMPSAGYRDSVTFTMPSSYIRSAVTYSEAELDGSSMPSTGIRAEYDMDEHDQRFLDQLNSQRFEEHKLNEVSPEMFEITMTLLEVEWFKIERMMPPKKKTTDDQTPGSDEQKCVICDEAECDNSNAIVFCDGCDIAVHQDCYGVPFIPEGQWLCRQCTVSRKKRVGCVFCPNKNGAFKQTDTHLWAHVLCSLWIPEVRIANSSYMEPVYGVEEVPRGRWKLHCYICRQKVGACVQCANKNCFTAFHPTCARRARLYMKMESGILGALHDPGSTVAYCDKHSPGDYALVNDVAGSVRAAREFYTNASAPVKKKRKPLRKGDAGGPIWQTESGAPIVPAVIVNTICDSMNQFRIPKFREFLLEVCRYWTLKRQMKRGASLIKRLQVALDLENNDDLSEGELGVKLEESEERVVRLQQLLELTKTVQQREELKLDASVLQRKIVDLVYFTESRLLSSMWQRVSSTAVRTGVATSDDKYLLDIENRVASNQFATIGEFHEATESIFERLMEKCLASEQRTKVKPLVRVIHNVQKQLSRLMDAYKTISRDPSTGLVDFRAFGPDGLEIHEEEWAGSRLRREMSPLTDLEDEEIDQLLKGGALRKRRRR